MSCSFLTQAQEATLQETEKWIFTYGTKLFQEGSTLYFYWENGEKELIHIVNDDGYLQECSFKWSDIRTVAAISGEKSLLVFVFKTDLDAIGEKGKTKISSIDFYFESKDGLLRFYKAIEHLFKLKQLTDVKFENSITLENKF